MSVNAITPSSLPSARSALLRYSVAVATVAASTLLGIGFSPHSYQTPFLLFAPAVVVSVWFGGFWPGILATLLSSLSANYFMFAPHDAFNLDTISVVQTLAFVSIFATISWFADLASQRLHGVIDIQSQLLEMSFDPVIVRDADDRVIYWNRGAERLYGFTKDEAHGRVTHDLLHTVHPRPVDEIRAELRKTGRWHGELVHTRKDGSTVPVESWWTLQQVSGRQSAILEANYDLSERRKTEESLRYLSAIVESSDAAIIGKTLDGIVTSWNPGAERLYGYTAEEMLGQPISRLSPSGHPNEFPTILRRLANGERIETYDTIRQHKDGTVIDVALKVSPIFDDAGKIIGASSIARDVRKRKQMERALRRSEERLRAATLAADIGVWYWTPGTSHIEVSANWRQLFGVPPEASVTFETWRDAIHPDDRERAVAELMAASVQHSEFITEYRVLRPDGTMRWVVDRGRAAYDDAGRPVSMAGVNVDITERKRAQEILVKHEKLASVGRMAATIAHEINNPLAAAMNALYLISSDPGLPETARPSLELAEHELERVAHITKQTLGFYRESGNATKVQLGDVVDGILSLFGPKLANRTLHVERRYRCDSPAFGVEGEIRQVVSNLIANSIDAMPQSGTLHVRSRGPVCLNGDRRLAQLTIADTGSGISPECVPRIFEPFFTTKAAIGTGLGLWVTKELVAKHHGRIRMRSRPGKGTVFTIWLPCDRRQAERVGNAGAA